MLHDLFTTAESTKEAPVYVSVPALVSSVRDLASRTVDLTVCADGHLVASAVAENTERHAVVTAWIAEGQGARHGRPERWRQNYRRAFASESAAEKRVGELLEKHGGKAGDQ